MEDGFSLRDSTVGIFGLGLMGGSLAMSLKGKCARIIGFDSHLPTLELALSKNIIDQARPHPQALSHWERGVDILILATPVSTIIDILQQLPSFIQHPCIIMDLGSTKRDILQAMSALPENFDPIGGHPICGKEKPGLENADANMYANASFIITPLRRTTRHALSITQELISVIGANLIEMTAEEHDRVFASTSHMPFLLSSALAESTPEEFSQFIGPGFRSTSRLAGTPSHMMMGILKSNRENVLAAIRNFKSVFSEIELALENEEYVTLENTLNESYHAYERLISTL